MNQLNVNNHSQLIPLAMCEAHSQLGEMMTLLYGGSAFRFYTLEVAKLLAQSTQLRYKIDALLANLKR